MEKYQTYARSRTPTRDERHRPARRDSSILAAARQVAARFVADHWPTLASVKPEVSSQSAGRRLPSPELIARLGLSEAELGPERRSHAFTFTFTSQRGTADGAVAPLVAAVTVDAQRRIVKAILSK